VFFYSRDRGGEHPEQDLAGYAGLMQADTMPASPSSTRPTANPDRSLKLRAGHTEGASSLTWRGPPGVDVKLWYLECLIMRKIGAYIVIGALAATIVSPSPVSAFGLYFGPFHIGFGHRHRDRHRLAHHPHYVDLSAASNGLGLSKSFAR
jgi:hypothetical protein